jgi:hypothetical protein
MIAMLPVPYTKYAVLPFGVKVPVFVTFRGILWKGLKFILLCVRYKPSLEAFESRFSCKLTSLSGTSSVCVVVAQVVVRSQVHSP